MFDSVQRTVEYFDTINWQLIERLELFDTLEDEFIEYQATVKGDVPQHILDEAFVKDTSQPLTNTIWTWFKVTFDRDFQCYVRSH